MSTSNEQPSRMPVVVVDFDMPFWSIVQLMVKWAIASIPAMLILAVFSGVLLFIFKTLVFISSHSSSSHTSSTYTLPPYVAPPSSYIMKNGEKVYKTAYAFPKIDDPRAAEMRKACKDDIAYQIDESKNTWVPQEIDGMKVSCETMPTR